MSKMNKGISRAAANKSVSSGSNSIPWNNAMVTGGMGNGASNSTISANKFIGAKPAAPRVPAHSKVGGIK